MTAACVVSWETPNMNKTCLKCCMSALDHHCWLYDQRTDTVVFEFRADDFEYSVF
ncbi:hypothetical protein BJX64DRAFT_246820 [Aspergillus heterothallicus]